MTCSQENIDLYNKVVSGEISPRTRFQFGRTALFYVRNLRDYNFLIKAGLSPFDEDDFGCTAISDYEFRRFAGNADRLQLSAELTKAFEEAKIKDARNYGRFTQDFMI